MPRTKAQQVEDDELITQIWTPPNRGTELIAIDPGDEHVGVAFFTRDDAGLWYCEDAQQVDDPDEFELALAETLLGTPNGMRVIYERFRLYEDKAQLQKGSEFRTSQMIGVIQFIARSRNQHVDQHYRATLQNKMLSCEQVGGGCALLMDGPRPIEVIGQMADIKKPTTGILRHKKIKSVGKIAKKENKGWGDHCIDAELHGWKDILDTQGGAPLL